MLRLSKLTDQQIQRPETNLFVGAVFLGLLWLINEYLPRYLFDWGIVGTLLAIPAAVCVLILLVALLLSAVSFQSPWTIRAYGALCGVLLANALYANWSTEWFATLIITYSIIAFGLGAALKRWIKLRHLVECYVGVLFIIVIYAPTVNLYHNLWMLF